MKRKLLSPLLAILFLMSCSHQNITLEDNYSLSKEGFMAMSLTKQFRVMAQWGGIARIDINNIELQRITSGIVRNYTAFSFNYCPVIDIYELDEQNAGTYSMGLRRGGPAGQVLDVTVILKEGNNPWAEVNGLRYNVQLNNYTAGNGSSVVEYTFTPSGTVPGKSEDYLNLIAALNNSNNGDVIRPELPLHDLRVLSLGSITLTAVIERGKTVKTAKAWDTTLASTLGRSGAGAVPVDPVYLDINQDEKLNVKGGLNVCFDINGDGVKDKVHEWNTLDAQLVYDVNRNHQIDDGREIMNETGIDGSQNKYRNGWEKARDIFDTNKDGSIEGSELLRTSYWTDSNGNGTVEPGELKTACELRIIKIDIDNHVYVFEE